MTAENTRKNVARRRCHRCAMGKVLLLAGYRQDDAVPLGRNHVRTHLVEIEDHSSHVRTRAVLPGSYLSHAVRIHRYGFGAVAADRVRKIQQDTVRIDRSINRGLYRSTDRDFNS